jgi:hypothetical protein
VSFASLLRDAAACLRTWCSRPSAVTAMVATSDATLWPTPHSNVPPKPQKLVGRIKVAREAVAPIHVAAPPCRRRPIQRQPTLWAVRSGDSRQRLYCGPVALSALIGANVDEVIRVIQQHRNSRRQVRGTRADELQHVFRQFGHDIQLVANLSRNPPTLATWERERSDWEFE